MDNITRLKDKFTRIFGGNEPFRVFTAPGRVNLIGEHIDYNGGNVFPAALDMSCIIIARPRTDGLIRLAADDLDGILVCCPLDKLFHFRGHSWGSYQLGIARGLLDAGHDVCGCDMLFWGDIPFASGLSSSAAIEISTALALYTLGAEAAGKKSSPDMTELARIAQRVENVFVGVNCGIMDQFASARGLAGHAILLNCGTLEYEHVPLSLGEYCILIANTNKPRGLAESKYNERRAECDEAFAALQAKLPDLRALCELTPEEFAENEGLIHSDVVRNRARHVVMEQNRVSLSVSALKSGDLAEFGALMNASHDSLRDLYEVTGTELDAIVDAIRGCDGVLGARMTGAGFGGCAVSIVRSADTERIIREAGERYTEVTGLRPEFYLSGVSDGAREIN